MRIEDGDTEGGNLVRQGGGHHYIVKIVIIVWLVLKKGWRLQLIDVIIVINHEDWRYTEGAIWLVAQLDFHHISTSREQKIVPKQYARGY